MPVTKKPRIAYLSGPSDAVNVYLEWSEGQKQNYFGTNYMKQFFELCRETNADAYIITTVAGKSSTWRKDGLTIENMPLPSHLGGAFYHMAMVGWFARLRAKTNTIQTRRIDRHRKPELLVFAVLSAMAWHTDHSVISLRPVASICTGPAQLAHFVDPQPDFHP